MLDPLSFRVVLRRLSNLNPSIPASEKEGRKERPGDRLNGRFNRCPHDFPTVKVVSPIKVIFRRFVS